MTAAKIFQIYYDAATQASLDPGFLPLDNLDNARPDWREYWPIRKYLAAHTLEPDTWYGFLSPMFRSKTGLSAAALKEFAERCPADTGAILISPSFDLHALFRNVFESGEFFHPGLTQVSQDFFAGIGQPTDLNALVMDSRNSVYSNFFLAKAPFWHAWFEVTEAIFEAAESPTHPLGAALRQSAGHGGQEVPMKVFLMERIASWMLVRDKGIKAVVHDPFSRPLSQTVFGRFPLQAAISDALKRAYVDDGYPAYWNAFNEVRQQLLRELNRNPA
jgi:hypothetical protein